MKFNFKDIFSKSLDILLIGVAEYQLGDIYMYIEHDKCFGYSILTVSLENLPNMPSY